MNQAAANAIGHYISKGLSHDVATGIVAVLMVESGLNPTSENNTGTETPGSINPTGSYGLAQWNGSRQQALMAFASAKGFDYSQFNTQLDFVLTESANSYPSVWAAMRQAGMTYANFIPVFVASYENPADKAGETAKAMAYAQEFYGYTIAAVPVPTTPAPVPTAPTPSTSGAFVMDPAIVAALEPLFDALMSSLIKALLGQLPTAAGGTSTTASPTALPAINLQSLAASVAGVVVPQLATTIQQIVSAELAKVIGAIPGATKS